MGLSYPEQHQSEQCQQVYLPPVCILKLHCNPPSCTASSSVLLLLTIIPGSSSLNPVSGSGEWALSTHLHCLHLLYPETVGLCPALWPLCWGHPQFLLILPHGVALAHFFLILSVSLLVDGLCLYAE